MDDLAFAAELGPRALVDEWMKLDKAGFEAKVATPASYFPTRAKWDEVRAMLGGGSDRRLRRLMAVCGNALGCRLLESAGRGISADRRSLREAKSLEQCRDGTELESAGRETATVRKPTVFGRRRGE